MKHKYMKKTWLLVTTAIMTFTTTGSCYMYGIGGQPEEDKSTNTQVKNLKSESVWDPSQYTDNEVFVSYTDGTYRVLKYENQEELKSSLQILSEDEDVMDIQPNYRYETAGSIVSDPDFAEQWALYNDGTFSPEEQEEQFPVYLNPFEDPINDLWDEFMNYYKNFPEEYDGRKQYNKAAATSKKTSSESTAVKGIDINVQDAWNAYHGGNRETIVAVIDTGIDYTHEDLADAIWKNEDEIAGDGIDNDGNGFIDDVYGWNFYNNSNQVYTGTEDSHGTHGAGTIAATRDNETGVAGIAGNSKVRIMSVKALGGNDGSGSTESIIKAIKYAKANGAVICNLSFGTNTDDSALKKAIADSNMLFIAAAGNGDNWTGKGVNDDTKPIYPAAYDLDNIISVANLSYDGTLHYSSNYGQTTVDLAAPGSYILSTTPQNTYSYMTGTSMAAPMVSAVAAMIYSNYSDVTIHQVKEMILQSTKSLNCLSGKVATGGMLDAYAALTCDYSKIPANATEETSTTKKESSGASSKGSAPVISATVGYSMLSVHKIMVLTVQDEDQDLEGVYFKKGSLTKKDFSDLSTCEKVTLDSSSKAIFKIVNGGTYTFYAYDAKGNSTLYKVTLRK